MDRLKRRIYRERRRVAIVAGLTFLAGYVSGTGDPGPLGLPMNLAMGVVLMLIITTMELAIALIFPSFRHGGEILAPMILVECLFDSSRFGTTDPKSFAIVLVWLLIFMALYHLYSTPLLDRFLRTRTATCTGISSSRLPPEALWPFFVQTPETPQIYWEPTTKDIWWIKENQSYSTRGQLPDCGQTFVETHTIHKIAPPHAFDFSFDVNVRPESLLLTTGAYSLRIESTPSGSRILRKRMTDGWTLRGRLFEWIDDGSGRWDDRTIERAEDHAA